MKNFSLIKPIISLKTSFIRVAVLAAFVWVPVSLGVAMHASAGYSDVQSSNANRALLSRREFSLDDRYGNVFVRDVFKDNILLNIAYLSGKVHQASDIHWDEIRRPFTYEFQLKSGEVFAFHGAVLPEYAGKVVKTSNTDFGGGQGFKSDGYLFGDGVCHLASLMDWAARDAKLSVLAPTSHDFAQIPDVPREYGAAIYATSAAQNLYIKNTFNKPVTIAFDYKGDKLGVAVYKNL